MRLASIVEGQGDVASLPIIVRRIAEAEGIFDLDALRPIRIPRQRLVRPGEIERAVDFAVRMAGDDGGVVVLIDGDDDAPCRLGPALLARAETTGRDVPCAVILAKREKEAWFLAATESLAGRRGLPVGLGPPEDPESIRGAKEWLSRSMAQPYSEVTDQPAFSALFDIEVARRRSPSFDKLWRDVVRLLHHHD